MPRHEQVAADYGMRRGWAVRTSTLRQRPPHWNDDYYGQADIVPMSSTPRAEAAWLAHVPGSLRAAVLWHELGHCEQMGELPWDVVNTLAPVQTWWVECDAWERGLAMAATVGYEMPPWVAQHALRCLLSYATKAVHRAVDVGEVPIVRYLEGVAYGE